MKKKYDSFEDLLDDTLAHVMSMGKKLKCRKHEAYKALERNTDELIQLGISLDNMR